MKPLSRFVISSRRSSSTTPARLHRACTVERLNTNLEELTKHNTADLFTKHGEGSRSQGNLDLESSGDDRGACKHRFQSGRRVRILSSSIWQKVHDTSVRLRPWPRDFKTTQTTKDWRFALMLPWASTHIGGSRSIPKVHRCPQGKVVGSPKAPQTITTRQQDSNTLLNTDKRDICGPEGD